MPCCLHAQLSFSCFRFHLIDRYGESLFSIGRFGYDVLRLCIMKLLYNNIIRAQLLLSKNWFSGSCLYFISLCPLIVFSTTSAKTFFDWELTKIKQTDRKFIVLVHDNNHLTTSLVYGSQSLLRSLCKVLHHPDTVHY